MSKKRRSLSFQPVLDPEPDLSSPRASPPPAFLQDDDPFANLNGSPADFHRVCLPPLELPAQPKSPLTPAPKSPPLSAKPVSARAPTPAHQKPAFAPKPSLPSLDALSRMNVVLTKKVLVRKGRVGAGLPFEPWDQTEPTSPRLRRPSTSPSSSPSGFTSPTSSLFSIIPADTLPSLASASPSSSSEPTFIHPADGQLLDADLLATCGVGFDSSSILSDTPPRSKIKARKQSIALDQPPPEFFSSSRSKSRPSSRRPSTSPGFSPFLSDDRDATDIFTSRDSVPGHDSGPISIISPGNASLELEHDGHSRRSLSHTTTVDALAGPVAIFSNPPVESTSASTTSSITSTLVGDIPDLTPTPSPIPLDPTSTTAAEPHHPNSLTTVPEHPSDYEDEGEEATDSILLAYTTESPVATCPNSPTPTPDSFHYFEPLPAVSSPTDSSTSASASRRSLSLSLSASSATSLSASLSRSTSSSTRSDSSSTRSHPHMHSQSQSELSGSGSPSAVVSSFGNMNRDAGDDGFIIFNPIGILDASSCGYGNHHYYDGDEDNDDSHDFNHGDHQSQQQRVQAPSNIDTVGDGVRLAVAANAAVNNTVRRNSSVGATLRTPPRVSSLGVSGRGFNYSAEGGFNCTVDHFGSDLTPTAATSPPPPPPTATATAATTGTAVTPTRTTTTVKRASGELGPVASGDLTLSSASTLITATVSSGSSPVDSESSHPQPTTSTQQPRYSYSSVKAISDWSIGVVAEGSTTSSANNNENADSHEYEETRQEGERYSYPSSRTLTLSEFGSRPDQKQEEEEHGDQVPSTKPSPPLPPPAPSSTTTPVFSEPRPEEQQDQIKQRETEEDDMLAYSNHQQRRAPPPHLRSSPSPSHSPIATNTTITPTFPSKITNNVPSATTVSPTSPMRARTRYDISSRGFSQSDFTPNIGNMVDGGVIAGPDTEFDPYRDFANRGGEHQSYPPPIRSPQTQSSPGTPRNGPPPSSWYSMGYGNGVGTQSQRSSRSGGGDVVDERRDRRSGSGSSTGGGKIKSRTSSFVNMSSSSEEQEEEEEEGEDSEATDDNVPLARSIPTALVAQKSIRKQVREERDRKRRERVTAAAAASTTTSSNSVSREPSRSKQVTSRPTTASGSSGGTGSVAAPQGMYTSSQEAAMHASALSRSVTTTRPSTAPGTTGRPRTQTLPGRTAPPFAAEDLTKKLQDVQQVSSTSSGASSGSGRHRRYPSGAAAVTGDADPYAMFMRAGIEATTSLIPPLPVSPIVIPPAGNSPTTVVEGQGQSPRALRPQRSFHRPSTRPSAMTEDHKSIPLPSNAPQQLNRARSNTRLRDDYTLKFDEASSRAPTVPRLSERVGREASVRSTSTRPSTDGYLSSTSGNGATPITSTSSHLHHPVERRPSSRRPSTADRDRSQTRPPVPPLPASIVASPPPPLPTSPAAALSNITDTKQVTQQRVFIGDMQSYNVVEIEDTTTAGDVVEMLEAQGSLKGWIGSGGWMVWEVAHDFGVERPVRHYERLSDIQASWNKDKLINAFVVRLTPIAPLLARSAIPSASPKFAGYVEWESKRGKWSKRWLQLREHSLWISKRDNGKDAVVLCSLSNFDAYQFCRPYKSPKPFVFAVKSTDKLSFFENTQDYKHVFSCSEKDGKNWMEKILLARSYVLHQERNILFNPKTYGGQPTVATSTGAHSRSVVQQQQPQQRRPTHPLVSVANGSLFEPGSLLHRQK